MLKPLAIGVMGALAISVLLSLVATPAVYYVLMRTVGGVPRPTKLAPEAPLLVPTLVSVDLPNPVSAVSGSGNAESKKIEVALPPVVTGQ